MRGKTAEGRKNNEDGSGRDEAERGNKRVTFKSNTDNRDFARLIKRICRVHMLFHLQPRARGDTSLSPCDSARQAVTEGEEVSSKMCNKLRNATPVISMGE